MQTVGNLTPDEMRQIAAALKNQGNKRLQGKWNRIITEAGNHVQKPKKDVEEYDCQIITSDDYERTGDEDDLY